MLDRCGTFDFYSLNFKVWLNGSKVLTLNLDPRVWYSAFQQNMCKSKKPEDNRCFHFYQCSKIKKLLLYVFLSKHLTFLILPELYSLWFLGLVVMVGHKELKRSYFGSILGWICLNFIRLRWDILFMLISFRWA